MSFNAPGVNTVASAGVNLVGKNSDVMRAFDQIEARLAALEASAKTVSKSMQTSNKQSTDSMQKLADKINETQRNLAKMKGKTISIKAADEASKTIQNIAAQADKLDEKQINVAASIVGRYNEQLNALSTRLREVDDQGINVEADVDTKKADASLRELETQVETFGTKQVTVKAVVDDDRAKLALHELQVDIAALPNRETIHFDVDTSKAESGISRLTDRWTAFRDTVQRDQGPSSFGWLSALAIFLPTLAPIINAVVGELGALGGAIQNIAPVAAIGGTGLAGILSAVVPTVAVAKTQSAAGKTVASQFQAAQNAPRGSNIQKQELQSAANDYAKLTAAQKDYVKAQIDAKNAENSFVKALQPEALKTYNTVLGTIFGTLKNITPQLKDGAGALAGLTADVSKEVNTTRFQEMLQQVAELGAQILKIADPAITKGLDAIRAVVSASVGPARELAQDFANWVIHLADIVLQAEKSGALPKVLEQAKKDFELLMSTIGNLGHGLFEFFAAGSDSGNNLLTTINNLAKRFNDFMTQARNDGSLKKWIDANHKEFDLIIKDLAQILGSFYQIGQTIGPTGYLNALLSTINFLVGAFSQLPAPVQQFVVELIAINTIGNKLGFNLFPLLIAGAKKVATQFRDTTKAVQDTTKAIEIEDAVGSAPAGGGGVGTLSKASKVEAAATDASKAEGTAGAAATEVSTATKVEGAAAGAGILASIKGIPAAVTNGIKEFLNLIKGIPKAITDILPAWDEVSGAFATASKVFGIIGLAIGAVTGAITDFKNNFLGLGDALKKAIANTGIPETLKNIWTDIQHLGDAINNLFKQITGGTGAVGTFTAIFNALWTAIKFAAEWIGKILGATVLLALIGTIQIASKIINLLVDAIDLLVIALTHGITWIKDFVGFVKTIPGIVSDAANAVSSFAQHIYNDVSKWIVGAFTDAMHWLEGVPKFFEGIGSDIVNALGNGVSNIGQAFLSPIKGAINGVIDIVNDFINLLDSIKISIPSVKIPFVGTVGGGTIGFSIPPIQHLSSGGPVAGTGRGDKYPALLEAGEYVIKRDVVSQWGKGTFDAINFNSTRPASTNYQRASGGFVPFAGSDNVGGGLSGSAVNQVVTSGLSDLYKEMQPLTKQLTSILQGLKDTVTQAMKAYNDAFNSGLKTQEQNLKTSLTNQEQQVKQHYANELAQQKAHLAQVQRNQTAGLAGTASASSKAGQASVANFLKELGKMPDGTTKVTDSTTKAMNSASPGFQHAAQNLSSTFSVSYGQGLTGVGKNTKTQLNSVITMTNQAVKNLGGKGNIALLNTPLPTISTATGASAAGVLHAATNDSNTFGATAAQGLRLAGQGLMDHIPILAAPGEVVLNRHQEGYLEDLTGMPGILDHVLGAVQKPHHNFALGGRINVTKPSKGFDAAISNSSLGDAVKAANKLIAGQISLSSQAAGGTGPLPNFGPGSASSLINRYFKGQGFNKINIAGLIGNWTQESGLNWSSPGGYIAQWGGDRLSGLINLAKKENVSVTNPNVQLQWADTELRGPYHQAFVAAQNATSPAAAASAYMNLYEKPAAWAANLPHRQAAAEAAYKAGYARGGRIPGFATGGPVLKGTGTLGDTLATLTSGLLSGLGSLGPFKNNPPEKGSKPGGGVGFGSTIGGLGNNAPKADQQLYGQLMSVANNIIGKPYSTNYGRPPQLNAKGYDCSAAVSTMLNIGGKGFLPPVGSNYTTDNLKTWGLPGPGKNVTVGVRGTTGANAHTMLNFYGKYLESGGGGPFGRGSVHWDPGWDGDFPIKRHPKGFASGGVVGTNFTTAVTRPATTTPTSSSSTARQRANIANQTAAAIQAAQNKLNKAQKDQLDALKKWYDDFIKQLNKQSDELKKQEGTKILHDIGTGFTSIFNSLKKYIGSNGDFTKGNIQLIANIEAYGQEIQKLANMKIPEAPKGNSPADRAGRDAVAGAKALKEQAQQAAKSMQDTFQQLGDAIANSGQEVYSAFTSTQQSRISLAQGVAHPTATTASAIKGLTGLAPTFSAPAPSSSVTGAIASQFGQGGNFGNPANVQPIGVQTFNANTAAINKYLKALKDVNVEQKEFNREQQSYVAIAQAGAKQITDLGSRLKLLGTLQKKTGQDMRGSMQQVRDNIVAAAQSSIDAVNQYYDNQKSKMDQQLSDTLNALQQQESQQEQLLQQQEQSNLDAVNNAAQAATDAENASYQKRQDAFNAYQTALTRDQQREQAKRDQLATTQQLGKLTSQEFFTKDDLSNISQLQGQLAGQLQSQAQTEQGYNLQDQQAAMDKQHQDNLDKINEWQKDEDKAISDAYQTQLNSLQTNYNDAVGKAEQDYADGLVKLNKQVNDQINGIVDSAAKALGVPGKKIWNILLGGNTVKDEASKQGQDTAGAALGGILSTMGDTKNAGAKFVQTFADGIASNHKPAIDAVKDLLKQVDNLLPHSDAEEGPLSNLTESGSKLWPTFAKGVEKSLANFEIPAPSMPDIVGPNVPNGRLTNTVSSNNTQTLKIDHKVTVDARGMTPAEKQQLIDEIKTTTGQEIQRRRLVGVGVTGRP